MCWQQELMITGANESAYCIDEDLDLNGISIPQDGEIHTTASYFRKKHFASPCQKGEA